MTAPFSPELLSPKPKGASPSTVTLQWKFRSVVAGDHMATYAIRRRQMSPSVGSYEYWNGTIWVGSEAFVAGPSGGGTEVKDGMTHSVAISTGWTNDRIYQWAVKCRNAATEASAYSEDILVQVHVVPSMALTVSSSTISRPRLSWVWAGASGYYQKSYQLCVYTAAVQSSPGFDASSAVWQALATWNSGKIYSATDWNKYIGADLVSGTQYYVYYRTEDNSDLSSGWVNGMNFTPSYTTVPAPSLTLTPDEANGVVSVTARSSFNLLDDNHSIFTAGIGNWIGSLNCETSWNSTLGKLLITCGGRSYAALDTAYALFSDMDTALTTFEVTRTTQASPTGTARAVSGDQTGERIAVTNGVAYSAIATARNTGAAARTGKLGIRWYTAAHAASTTPVSQGTGVTLNPGVDTTVKVENITAPADAAWAVVEFEWTTAAVGDTMLLDDVAIATTSTIVWSPSGNNFDISFVIERSTDQVTWVPLWGCGTLSPKVSDSGAVSQVIISDRAAPLGTQNIYYRAYAISKFSTAPVWSAVATNSVAGMKPEKWFLRRTQTPSGDTRIRAADFGTSINLDREVFNLEGMAQAVVAYGSSANIQFVDVTVRTETKAEHTAVMNALLSKETLYIQTNADGDGYYVRPVDRIRKDQRRSRPDESYQAVRHLFEVTFTAAVVEDYV